MLDRLPDLVNGDAALVRRGRYVDVNFLLEVGPDVRLVGVQSGRITGFRTSPLVMPRWSFALRAPAEAWQLFWQPVPPPGSHDLFALIKRRALTAEGDLHVFMANLFYFKAALAKPRELSAALPSDDWP